MLMNVRPRRRESGRNSGRVLIIAIALLFFAFCFAMTFWHPPSMEDYGDVVEAGL